MPADPPLDIRIRPATLEDREFLHRIAPRLLVGYASWRDQERMLKTVDGFLQGDLEAPADRGMMVIAERADGTRLGVAGVAHNVNFTGERQAYLGELAVIEEAEGMGVGRLLVEAVERWARDNGHNLLVLDTGAANERARAFYEHLGYREESVRLAKQLGSASGS
ncbi:MAG TPA: GNAT family N-acetyltransferase [Chloroflexota bacterium]|nr:GNAT family N-acetyltransferase [Chloroflexota bacterium]